MKSPDLVKLADIPQYVLTITFMKWCIDFSWGWRTIAFNWVWGRWEFGRWRMWYDGNHSAFIVGPFNVYWNWGDFGPEDC